MHLWTPTLPLTFSPKKGFSRLFRGHPATNTLEPVKRSKPKTTMYKSGHELHKNEKKERSIGQNRSKGSCSEARASLMT